MKTGLFLSFLIPKLSENENSWVFGFSFRCVRKGLTSRKSNVSSKFYTEFTGNLDALLSEVAGSR